MRTLILAGGFGTRLSELTEAIPKPMVPIGGKPILWHIMQYYSAFGHDDFVIALGYKSEVIKEFFLGMRTAGSDFTVKTQSGLIEVHESSAPNWKVTLVNTGTESLTGERVARVRDFMGDETFFLTYGDGVSDVDLDHLLDFHRGHGKLLTMTAVRPPARFGELSVGANGVVESFVEKQHLNTGWINGGFLVVEPGFFDLIPRKNVMLEREPFEEATKLGEMFAYKHRGFWQCMDTKRDVDFLRKLWDSEDIPWIRD